MNADLGRRRPLFLVLVLLVISVMVDRLLIAGLCPWVSSLGGISLMAVFLDIPVAFPMIDPLPVSLLFSLFYSMMPATAIARSGGDQGEGLSRIWGGFIVLSCWMAAGALAFHFSEGFLTRQVRNGIDSFGIQADIHTPFSEYSILPLRGGIILLLCFIIGGRTFVKRVNRVSIARPVPGVIIAEADGRGEMRSQEEMQSLGELQSREEVQSLGEVQRVRQLPQVESPVCTMVSVQPPAPVAIRPRTAAKSVAIVAPRQVVLEKQPNPTLY